ncbi:hypothetical protein D3C75_1076460 [compost metagenome]
MGERSIISPSSQTALPAMLCPPPRTDTSRLFCRAKLTACTTDSGELQRAMMAGRRSIMAFQICRASSYSASAGRSTVPWKSVLNWSIAAFGNCNMFASIFSAGTGPGGDLEV